MLTIAGYNGFELPVLGCLTTFGPAIVRTSNNSQPGFRLQRYRVLVIAQVKKYVLGMVLILDGSSEHGAHIRSKSGVSIC